MGWIMTVLKQTVEQEAPDGRPLFADADFRLRLVIAEVPVSVGLLGRQQRPLHQRAPGEDHDLRALAPGVQELAGVPFAVKNLFDVAGLATLAGSRIERSRPPAARDAALIRRLEAEGAVLVGAMALFARLLPVRVARKDPPS